LDNGKSLIWTLYFNLFELASLNWTDPSGNKCNSRLGLGLGFGMGLWLSKYLPYHRKIVLI